MDIYRKCKAQENLPKEEIKNYVHELYDLFTDEEISQKMTEMLKPDDVGAEVKIVYQSLEGLHQAIPGTPGDWYFSGNYPTPGGNMRLNRAYIDYVEENLLNNSGNALS